MIDFDKFVKCNNKYKFNINNEIITISYPYNISNIRIEHNHIDIPISIIMNMKNKRYYSFLIDRLIDICSRKRQIRYNILIKGKV